MQVDKKYITKSFQETQKLGEKFAKQILLSRTSPKTAVVLTLHGNLGGGKTTFLQGFAKGLGIKEKITSPTFVIMKRFTLSSDRGFRNFYHIDCYRLIGSKDILELFSAQGGPASGWKKIISDSENIVAIEWPEKIKKVLPKNIIKIEFKFIDETTREINFKM
jgi:tRNA threonylcarbamoyladenosine biosynthesis protein TsaE